MAGIEVGVAIAGAAATLLSGAITSLLREHSTTEAVVKVMKAFVQVKERTSTDNSLTELQGALPSEEGADVGFRTRLREVRDALRRQRVLAIAYRAANSLLVIGQFIIGGLLTSSFLQEQLSKNLIGVLGLLVLLASLLRQHFRPDVQVVRCLQRASRLRGLVRTAEDQMFARREGSEEAPSLTQMRKRLSDGLTEIEESEAQEADLASAGSKRRASRVSRGRKTKSAEPEANAKAEPTPLKFGDKPASGDCIVS
jgi:hypothetical protein